MCAFGPTLMQGSAFNSCVCPSEACCETLFRGGLRELPPVCCVLGCTYEYENESFRVPSLHDRAMILGSRSGK